MLSNFTVSSKIKILSVYIILIFAMIMIISLYKMHNATKQIPKLKKSCRVPGRKKVKVMRKTKGRKRLPKKKAPVRKALSRKQRKAALRKTSSGSTRTRLTASWNGLRKRKAHRKKLLRALHRSLPRGT